MYFVATEETDVSSDVHQAGLGSTHSLDVSKPAHLPRPGTVATNSDNSPHATPCGNIVIIENSLHNRGAASSVIVPFSSQGCTGGILPLSNKLKISHKSVKAMPKITVNANNLQRLQQKGKPPSQQQNVRKNPVNDIDDELGNILDIPIIFAKDDDSLSNIDKMPVATQSATVVKETQEKPKLNSTTKVVLISNKQDKQMQQGKLGASSTQAVICPASLPVQNLNHLILQTRSQNTSGSSSNNGGGNVASAKSRVGMSMLENRLVQQPTVKYTKIILAKRNAPLPQQMKRVEQIIATKTSDDTSAPKILTFEKDDNRFVQASSGVPSTTAYEDPFAGNVLEIEDAIKTNIIERKYASTPAVDPTSSIALVDDDCFANVLDEVKLDETPQLHPERPTTFDDAGETQS